LSLVLDACPLGAQPDVIPYGDVALNTLPASGAGSVLASCHSLLATWEPSPDAQGTPVTQYKVEWFTAPGVNEVQTVTSTGATGGAFTLTYGSDTTDFLVFDLSQNGMKEALEGLPSIQQVDVKRTVRGLAYACAFGCTRVGAFVFRIPVR
jgi:hypothetical protein